jgi:glycosyltransferase involved in cell wall biosynthesis
MTSASGCESVSLVLPAFNEELNVRRIYDSIRSPASPPEGLENIFVGDGSVDGTAECVPQLRLQDLAVRLIRFGRDFGHQSALFAGLQVAHGAAVITMDCDLQHPPELLPRMLEAWRGGARVVQMVRLQTDDAGWVQTDFLREQA